MEILLDNRVWNAILEVSKSGRYKGFSIEIYSTGGGTIQSTNGVILLSLPFSKVIDGTVGKWSFVVPSKSKATKKDLIKIEFDPVVSDSKCKVQIVSNDSMVEYSAEKHFFPDTKTIEDRKGVDTGASAKFTFGLEQSALLWKVFEMLDFGDCGKRVYPTIRYQYGWEHGFVEFKYGGYAIVMGVL